MKLDPPFVGVRHLVDSELVDLLNSWRARDLSHANLEQVRAASRALVDAEVAFRTKFAPTGFGPLDEIYEIAGEDGAIVRIFVYRPPCPSAGKRPRPCFLTMHGGGYVSGSPDQHSTRYRALAKVHNCIVVAPEYRLAPEAPYPAALNDCLAALKWAHANAAMLGIDPSAIVIGGECSGGGLAAAVALAVREKTDIVLAGQILVYPMLDDRTDATTGGSSFTSEFLWTRNSNRFAWDCYLQGTKPTERRYAVPARFNDLSDLPSTHIFVGALDIFRDECIAYANRLMEGGVPASLHVYAGAYHAFDLAPAARLTKKFQSQFAEALNSLFKAKATR